MSCVPFVVYQLTGPFLTDFCESETAIFRAWSLLKLLRVTSFCRRRFSIPSTLFGQLQFWL